MTALIWLLGGVALGAAAVLFLVVGRRESPAPRYDLPASSLEGVASAANGGPADAIEQPAPDPLNAVAPPHLLTLVSNALRGPLRELRRTEIPGRAREQIERVAWQLRMLTARPRPMQSKPTSPLSLLQEASEEVALLRDGQVSASWSILNRQPAHVDPERMRAAFRELLAGGAEVAGPEGRIAIRILQGSEAGFPITIEIEIGRRGTEADPLSMLVARHLVETQGGRLELDGNVTRIQLRSAAPELAAAVA